jgi:monooxygenase
MLQRSPTYVVSRPAEDKIANWLRRLACPTARPTRSRVGRTWRCRCSSTTWRGRGPMIFKRMLAKGVRRHLGENMTSSTSRQYNPWDQRLCLVPDSDLFKSIRDGSASVVTDQIETFTETGLQLKSGEHLDADIIVTATGLVLKLMSGLATRSRRRARGSVEDDGLQRDDVQRCSEPRVRLRLHERVLDVEVRPHGRVRLPAPEPHGPAWLRAVHPRANDPSRRMNPSSTSPPATLSALHTLPRQGSKTPWRLHQNYVRDLSMLRYGRVDDGTMEFKAAPNGSRADEVVTQHG